MGMLAVEGMFLRVVIASMAVMSGRFKSVSMRSGRSVKALCIPCPELVANDVS